MYEGISSSGMFADQHFNMPFLLRSSSPWIWTVAFTCRCKSRGFSPRSSPSYSHSHRCLILQSLDLRCSISVHLAELWAWQPLSSTQGGLCVIALIPPWYCRLFHGTQVDCYLTWLHLHLSLASTLSHQVWPFSSGESQCTFLRVSYWIMERWILFDELSAGRDETVSIVCCVLQLLIRDFEVDDLELEMVKHSEEMG